MATNDQLGSILTNLTLEKAAADLESQAKGSGGKEEKEAKKTGNDIDSVLKEDSYGEGMDELERLREARLAQLKKARQQKAELLTKGHGSYTEIAEEDFLKEVTGSQRVACHFYSDKFQRCKIMDMHLSKMAKQYIGTKFVKLNAEKAPFFCAKLAIRTLPTLVLFKDGVVQHQVVGFGDMGGSDEFKTSTLAKLVKSKGVLEEKVVLEDKKEEDDDD
uniref:Thioredoxin domain-containing protein n=1 Tax=Chromera velia CCMP2878 TaxID=1169474 RepID=A0A0G4FZ74_9ALVE|mmetsp:Transcript_42940/g.84678  ORF Transcript_42940/g.84678 Transcript_42940/m.84678 type:complete len:218 (-) Transcript_42940:125-778(-)|eukprot:Cvel_19363.t1-p1 / transcript=Cvel_19363.t1 / gene=Cvel_19363 / organism=Chromera_velia_CCMP2878 / gene_product=Thioredoxin domain-containing protein 9, putative / transcript_product=Thioredoxin domain-containing protein 9, putative / location=Cvel_scaffold1664:8532-12531(-) / protein_length=217 / sequence_SO=supercontig / SO=protein_coding / is_pseudo=false